MNFRGAQGHINLQVILPLFILLAILLAFAMLIPTLTPTKSIVLVGGIVLFILSFISTEIALYILILSMLLSPEFIVGSGAGTALRRGITLRMDDLILVIIGVSWIARMAINKELGLFLKTPLNKPIAYYITVCLVSTLFGAAFGRVKPEAGFLFVLKYFEYMIVYFTAVNHLRERRQVRNYLWAMLVTCMIVSIMGIIQIPEGGRVSAPFEGQAGEPNTFGGYLVFMICLVIGLLLTEEGLRKRLIYCFLIFLFIIPLLYTQSRSSYLAAIPALLSFLWFSRHKHWVLLALLLVGLTLPFLAPKPTKERVEYTFTQGKNRKDVVEVGGIKLDTSSSARLKSWYIAAKDWGMHPLLGFGVTGYRFVDAQYVRTITETGFLGLLTFLILMGATFREGYRVLQDTQDPFLKGLTMGFLAGFIGLLAHAFGANTFIIVRIMEPFWFTAAMVIMIPEIERN